MRAAYAWLKDPNTNSDRCVTDENICIFNTKGEPVRYCSFKRNQDKQICIQQSSMEAQSAYRILGCYNGPDCGGNVRQDTSSSDESSLFCPKEELDKCSEDKPMNELLENCIELREGTMPSSPVDQNYSVPPYCYLGRSPAPYVSTKTNGYYDPCGVSFKNNGIDLVPKACFNRFCCPGSFGNGTSKMNKI